MGEDLWICPDCGAELRVGVRGCPVCTRRANAKRKKVAARKAKARTKGKAARHSWEQDSAHDGLDLPDEDFDYDDFVAREFGKAPHRRMAIRWYWWVTAVVLLILIVLAGFRLAG